MQQTQNDHNVPTNDSLSVPVRFEFIQPSATTVRVVHVAQSTESRSNIIPVFLNVMCDRSPVMAHVGEVISQ